MMKRTALRFLTVLCVSLVLPACAEKPRIYKQDVKLDRGLDFRPRLLSRGGAINTHPCIRGAYNYVYDTPSGQYGQREVWLCCVPVAEILSSAFDCGSGSFPASTLAQLFGGNADYWKIRSCTLLHPTAATPTHVPVCIPAPLQAPQNAR